MINKLTNPEIIQILKEVLAAMEVKGVNMFRVRAYQNATAAMDNITSSIFDLWQNNRLDEIPGVGTSLKNHLTELFTTGKVQEFDALRSDLPQGMFSLIGIRGLGAKKAFKLATAFHLTNRETAVATIEEAAQKGKIRLIEGFGEKSESDILLNIQNFRMAKNSKKRLLYSQAEVIAQRVLAHINAFDSLDKVEILGSFRRKNPTIGDLDIAVATSEKEAFLDYFLTFPEIEDVLAQGDKKVSVVLKNDIQIDVRVADLDNFGSMVQYFTGSKQHNIILRTYALERGFSLSEYGIKKGDFISTFSNEIAFYNHIGLQYIPPELRHGFDEVTLASQNKLPELVELGDIKGDLHTHTTYSDGEATLEEMAERAIEKGYAYYGFADHAPSVASRGEKEVNRLITEIRSKVDALNRSQDKTHFLFGFEVNLLADGTLGLADEYLAKLDYVIMGVHTAFDQDRDTVTKRVCMGLRNPFVNIWAHPASRVINERDGIDLDWKVALEVAKENNKILEISGQPSRLDLSFDLVRDVVKEEIPLVINTDSHTVDSLEYMRYGVDVARRGSAQKSNIINTLSKKDFLERLLTKGHSDKA